MKYIIPILLITLASCKVYTNVNYKMTGIYPCRDFDYYEFKYKHSVVLVKDSANAYQFDDTLKFTK